MQIPRTLQKISQIFNKMFTNVQIVFRTTIRQFFPFIYLGGGLCFKFLALNFFKQFINFQFKKKLHNIYLTHNVNYLH